LQLPLAACIVEAWEMQRGRGIGHRARRLPGVFSLDELLRAVIRRDVFSYRSSDHGETCTAVPPLACGGLASHRKH